MTLEYDDETHTYTDLDAGGCEVPSVSQIIRAAGLVSPFVCSPAAARRGTYVHELCESDDMGTLDPADGEAQENPWLRAWRAFKRDAHVEVLEIEAMVWSEAHYYAGRLDRVVRLAGHPRPIVLDLKSGGRSSWHKLQTALYTVAKAERDSLAPFAYDFATLYITNTARYSLAEPEDPEGAVQQALGIVGAFHRGVYA